MVLLWFFASNSGQIKVTAHMAHILCKFFRVVAEKEVNMSQLDFTRVECVGHVARSFLLDHAQGVGATSTTWSVFTMLGGGAA